MVKRVIALGLSIIFAILTICGIIYDFVITGGEANVIVATLPMTLMFICLGYYRYLNKEDS